MGDLDCDLSVEETHRLVEEIQANPANATNAFDKLIKAFGKLVHWQVYKRHTPTLNEDLVQEGNIALIDAAFAFDATNGAKFSTFATTVVRNRMIDYVRHEYDRGMTRKPKPPLDPKVERGEKPAAAPFVAVEDAPEKAVTDGWTEREAAVQADLKRFEPLLGPALDRLSENQQQVVLLCYVDEQPQVVVARRLGVSAPRVNALLKTVLLRLQENLLSLRAAA
jgi:RNA polymerase sigma factor (sigma-70 family)